MYVRMKSHTDKRMYVCMRQILLLASAPLYCLCGGMFMYSRILILALGLSSPLMAQFVNAVKNNYAPAKYVNGFSTWPSDQVVQTKMVTNVVRPPAPAPPAPITFQKPLHYTPLPADGNVSGLPTRAREALETASLENTGVVSTTDASGVARFSTTVNGREIMREPKRSERFMTPLNKSLWLSLVWAAEVEPLHSHRGRR